MAVTDQQKLDFLLKKIGYTKTKTGSVVGTGAISGTPKQPFAEAIPSPLIIANGALWNESDQIPTTPPGSDTTQVKVYLAASSGLRMTADATSSGQRAYIAYSTYNDTSSTRLTNWIDTQFGSAYLIKVYKGDPNSGGVALSAAGSGANDGWFFDYSAGVLNFNDTSVPSGVTDTNIYIVGYRYIGSTGAPTPGTSLFNFTDLTISRNLSVGGISTFTGLLDANGGAHIDNLRLGIDADNDITTSAGNLTLDSASGTTIVDDDLNVTGDLTVAGVLTYEDVKNVDAVGLITARSGIRVTGGVIEAQALDNKIPFLFGSMGALPSASTYHGMFAHVHSTGRAYFAHDPHWLELVNRETNGRVGTGTDHYFIDSIVSSSSTTTSLNITGVTTTVTLDVNGDLDVDGHAEFDAISVSGVTTSKGKFHIRPSSGALSPKISYDDSIAEAFIWVDNVEARFGTSSDFRIYHETPGDLNIIETHNDRQIHIRELDGTNIAKFIPGGSVELYHSGTKHFETSSAGVNIVKDLDVDGHTNLDNVSIAGVTTFAGIIEGVAGQNKIPSLYNAMTDLPSASTYHGMFAHVHANGKAYFAHDPNWVEIVSKESNGNVGTGTETYNISILNVKDLDVDQHTNLDNVSVAGVTTFAAATRFDDTITAGGSVGTNGQYLKSTGSGVAWETLPSLRTRQTFTASAGQTTFSFAYTVGFLDVYVNGIKLTDAEFTATNGSSTVLAVGCFVGDIVELVAYNTVSAGGAAFGIGNVVEDLSPQLGGNLDLFNKTVEGTGSVNMTGIVTATKFVGDGSLLTGIVASGSGIIVRDSDTLVGTATTLNFGANLSVSPVSAGIVTITAAAGGGSTTNVRTNTLNVIGVSTFAGITTVTSSTFFARHASFTGNVTANSFVGSLTGTASLASNLTGTPDISVRDLDVDGHANLDNVSVIGVTTFSSAITVSDIRNDTINLRNAIGGATYATFTNGGSALLKWNNTDRLETTNAGITVTGTVAATSYTGDGSQLTGITGISTADVRTNTLQVIGVSTLRNAIVDSFVDVGNNIQLGNAGVITATTFNGGTFFGTGADINGDIDVDGHTNLDNVSIAGFVTATKYFGDGSGLTGVTASGTGVVIKDDGTTVGTAGTFNFTSPIDVTPVSAGIVTVGINTVGFDVNKLSVSGISTFQDDITLASKIKHEGDTTTSFGFPENLNISFNTNGGERFRIGPLGQFGLAGGQYGTAGQVLTSQGSGAAVQWTTVASSVGITTNIANGYTQNAGTTTTIDTYNYGTDDLVFEYTIFVKIGSAFQSQKVLAMRDGSTIHSTQFAVMFSSTLLVQAEAVNSGGNIVLQITPETGISGSGNYRVKREVM